MELKPSTWNRREKWIENTENSAESNENKSDMEPVKIVWTAAAEIKNILKFYY